MSNDRRSLVQMITRRGIIAAGALATYSLIPVKSSLAACTNPLEPLLEAAAAAFNIASSNTPGSSAWFAAWNAYGLDYLDQYVTLVTPSGKNPDHRDGPGGVIEYLQQNSDQDQFLLATCSFKTSTGTLAVGKGYWKDNNNVGCSFSAGTCPQIHYVFKFTSPDPTVAKIDFMKGTKA
jgi:hypothetical protein